MIVTFVNIFFLYVRKECRELDVVSKEVLNKQFHMIVTVVNNFLHIGKECRELDVDAS